VRNPVAAAIVAARIEIRVFMGRHSSGLGRCS
jgi:hypothetical protein